jgi:hypothetical protein
MLVEEILQRLVKLYPNPAYHLLSVGSDLVQRIEFALDSNRSRRSVTLRPRAWSIVSRQPVMVGRTV